MRKKIRIFYCQSFWRIIIQTLIISNRINWLCITVTSPISIFGNWRKNWIFEFWIVLVFCNKFITWIKNEIFSNFFFFFFILSLISSRKMFERLKTYNHNAFLSCNCNKIKFRTYSFNAKRHTKWVSQDRKTANCKWIGIGSADTNLFFFVICRFGWFWSIVSVYHMEFEYVLSRFVCFWIGIKNEILVEKCPNYSWFSAPSSVSLFSGYFGWMFIFWCENELKVNWQNNLLPIVLQMHVSNNKNL